MQSICYASGDIDVEVVEEAVAAAISPGMGRGTFLRGLFNSPNVTPSSLVIPTTGGSPFFTNSYIPVSSR